jgi:uncharacterized Zn finger protein
MLILTMIIWTNFLIRHHVMTHTHQENLHEEAAKGEVRVAVEMVKVALHEMKAGGAKLVKSSKEGS